MLFTRLTRTLPISRSLIIGIIITIAVITTISLEMRSRILFRRQPTENTTPRSEASALLLRALGVQRSYGNSITLIGPAHPDLLLKSLQSGADPNITIKSGYSPMMVAAMQDCNECVRVLSQFQADPNRHGELGITALSLATTGSSIDTMRALLKCGARVNEPETGGYTPLMRAVMRADSAKVSFLIDSGASIHTASVDGSTAISLARRLNPRSAEIERLLNSGK